MKKILLTGTLATLCIATVAFSGCVNFGGFTYDHAELYTAGNGSASGTVTDLEIDWVDGSIEIAYGDVETVTFSETSGATLDEEQTMHYWLEGTTLHLKFAQSKRGVLVKSFPKKDLKVTLPKESSLREVDIDAVDTQVNLEGISVSDLDIETVDGNVNAYLVGTLQEISVETVGGDVAIESVVAPLALSFESVGGSLTLGLGDVEGFTFEIESLGGTFTSEFETVKNGKRYVYGTGACQYEAETVGGSVRVRKLAPRD